MIRPRKAPESTLVTAQRLTRLLAPNPFGMTRRQLQYVLFPTLTADTDRASWTGQALHLARDRGWVKSYGRKFTVTAHGRDLIEGAEVFTQGEGA